MFRTCFHKSPVLTVIEHVPRRPSFYIQVNPDSIFKEMLSHVLALESGTRYQQILKTYPKALSKNR